MEFFHQKHFEFGKALWLFLQNDILQSIKYPYYFRCIAVQQLHDVDRMRSWFQAEREKGKDGDTGLL